MNQFLDLFSAEKQYTLDQVQYIVNTDFCGSGEIQLKLKDTLDFLSQTGNV